MAIMNNAPGDPPVTRIDHQDFGATEPDNTSLYQAKGEYRSSLQRHFPIPQNIWGPVRNLFIMASSVSANAVDRRRSLEQLHIMAHAGDEMAAVAVAALTGLVIEP